MKVITLGTGGPRPDAERNATCTLVSIGEQTLMFDVGRGTIRSIAKLGIPFASIDPLFITHHHVDHIGEFADYTIASWLGGRRKPLRVFGPPLTAALAATLRTQVYDRDIAFRTEGETAFGPFVETEVTEVRGGLVHDEGRWKVWATEVEHGHGLPFSTMFKSRWVCLGYRIEAEGKVVTISGDTVMCDALVELARGSDLHVQVCYMAAADLTTDHFRGVAKYTLACSDTVGKIAAAAGVKRMVLTHFRHMTPERYDMIREDVRREFHGALDIARDLDQFEV